MTSFLDTQAYVAENPFDQVAALALVDRVQEEFGSGRVQALRAVARIRRPGRDAIHLQDAAVLLSCGSLGLVPLLGAVLEIACPGLSRDTAIYLVRGYRWPQVLTIHDVQQSSLHERKAVAVGARWIVQVYKCGFKAGRLWAKSIAAEVSKGN